MFSITMNKSRKIEGKPFYYRTDGTGRDGYIERSGFIGEQPNLSKKTDYQGVARPYQQQWNYSCKTQQSNTILGTCTLKENAVVSYKNDGTGRDNYISSNQGGIVKGSCSGKNHYMNRFKRTLRTYSQLPNRDEYQQTWNCQKTSVHWKNSKSQLIDQQIAQNQSLLIQRLAIPKKQPVYSKVKDQRDCNHTFYKQILQKQQQQLQQKSTQSNSRYRSSTLHSQNACTNSKQYFEQQKMNKRANRSSTNYYTIQNSNQNANSINNESKTCITIQDQQNLSVKSKTIQNFRKNEKKENNYRPQTANTNNSRSKSVMLINSNNKICT